jgi:hypothetical protein
MEYWVTIDVPASDNAFGVSIFEELMSSHPEVGPVMDLQLPSGPTSFVMGVEAPNSLAASSTALSVFREAIANCGHADAEEASVIDLHAELAPDEERDTPELQTAP